MHVLYVLSLLIQRIGNKVSVTFPVLCRVVICHEKTVFICRMLKWFLTLHKHKGNLWFFTKFCQVMKTITFYWFSPYNLFLSFISLISVLLFSLQKVQPFAASLSLYLPELWHSSGEHNMLRCAIVSTMTHLVEVWKSILTEIKSWLQLVLHRVVD